MKPETTKMVRRLTEAGLKLPKVVTLAVTNRCNLHCRHCWPESGPDVRTPVVPKNKVLHLMASFSVLGAEELVITGGEPLTHPDWIELLTFACMKLDFKEIRLQTNASFLTAQHMALLRPLTDHGLILQVSMEGATAENHDRVRGEGSFRQTAEALRLLVKNKMARHTWVALTEMRHNFDDIPQLLEMVDNLGILRFITSTLVCDGRAVQTDGIEPPTPDQYEELVECYQNDPVFRDRYGRIGQIAALEWATTEPHGTASCCTLIESPYVTAEGRLYPCVMLHAPEYSATEIYNRPLIRSISEKIDDWSRLQQLSRVRPTQLENCKDCPVREGCMAGCMGRAYAAHGTVFAPEDRCHLRLAVHRRNFKKP